MKLDIKLQKENLITFKKIIANLKKTCPNQVIFITFDDFNIKLCTEYSAQSATYINGYYILGNQYFLEDNFQIQSKKPRNLIQLKILDFPQFSQNLSQVSDESQQVSLLLAKNTVNGLDKRYIKLKVQEEQGLDLSSQSEINLYFEEIFYPPSDNKLLNFFLKSNDLAKILDIAAKKEQTVSITIICSADNILNKQVVNVTIAIDQPCIEILYSDIDVQDTKLTDKQQFQKTFKIHHSNTKQLSQICQIEEYISVSVLNDDFSLYFEFYETQSQTDQTIMAIKSYVIPEYEDFNEDAMQKEEDVQEIKEEEEEMEDQQQQQHIQEDNPMNDLNSDDSD